MAHPGGAPPKFQTSDQLNTKFLEWKELFKLGSEKFGEIPDVEGFCDYIDSYRDLFSEYAKKPEFSDTIKRIKNWIYYRKKQLAMANKMPAAIFIFDAVNNAGYTNKQEVEQRISGELNTGATDPKLAADFAEWLKNRKV